VLITCRASTRLSPDADLSQNYGALGTTLGHEIGHAFDDQGSKYGPTGELENWWTAEDRARFDELAERLSAQFVGLEAAPGIALDTDLTLGENISDLAGVETALAALSDALAAGEGGINLEDGGDQQSAFQKFFLSYAAKRRKLRRPETVFHFARRARHSPPDLRTNIILSNIAGWYDAFGITQTDPLWRPPEQRLRIW